MDRQDDTPRPRAAEQESTLDWLIRAIGADALPPFDPEWLIDRLDRPAKGMRR